MTFFRAVERFAERTLESLVTATPQGIAGRVLARTAAGNITLLRSMLVELSRVRVRES